MTQDYYGTKRITAWPQHAQADQHGNETRGEGYAVKYADGYISWSPKDVFEAAYQPIAAMNFGHALLALKQGHRVARKGWNGKGMFVFMVAGSQFEVNREPLASILGIGTEVTYRPHLDMKDAQGEIGVWTPSQIDLFADDWFIVPVNEIHSSPVDHWVTNEPNEDLQELEPLADTDYRPAPIAPEGDE